MKDLADHILNNPDWIIKIEFDGDGKEIKPEGVTNLFKMTAEHKVNQHNLFAKVDYGIPRILYFRI
jgi:hypothetical protein